MKRKWKWAALLAAIFLVAVFALAAELGYWDRFKSVFVDQVDNASDNSRGTEVTGVRGVKK
jgi:hypothetical protein